MSNSILSPIFTEKFKLFLNVLLAVVLAWLLGKLIWSVIYSPTYELNFPSLSQGESRAPVNQVFSPVYLFGKVDKVAMTKPVVLEENVKKSRLNLKLLGVLLSPSMSVAIIENKGQSNSYAIDEEIQKNVVLQDVYEDYVLISNRGVLEKLEMRKTDSVFSGSDAASDVVLTAGQKAKIDDVKKNALKNPVSIMRYVRFQNVLRNGKLQAVKVWPRQEKEIFAALGFKSGDELISVDGNDVEKLSKSPELWQELLQKSQFELIVKRAGQEVPVSVELE